MSERKYETDPQRSHVEMVSDAFMAVLQHNQVHGLPASALESTEHDVAGDVSRESVSELLEHQPLFLGIGLRLSGVRQHLTHGQPIATILVPDINSAERFDGFLSSIDKDELMDRPRLEGVRQLGASVMSRLLQRVNDAYAPEARLLDPEGSKRSLQKHFQDFSVLAGPDARYRTVIFGEDYDRLLTYRMYQEFGLLGEYLHAEACGIAAMPDAEANPQIEVPGLVPAARIYTESMEDELERMRDNTSLHGSFNAATFNQAWEDRIALIVNLRGGEIEEAREFGERLREIALKVFSEECIVFDAQNMTVDAKREALATYSAIQKRLLEL